MNRNRPVHWCGKETAVSDELFHDAESHEPLLAYRLCPVVRGLSVDFYFHHIASVTERPSVWRFNYRPFNQIVNISAHSERVNVISEIRVFYYSPTWSLP